MLELLNGSTRVKEFFAANYIVAATVVFFGWAYSCFADMLHLNYLTVAAIAGGFTVFASLFVWKQYGHPKDVVSAANMVLAGFFCSELFTMTNTFGLAWFGLLVLVPALCYAACRFARPAVGRNTDSFSRFPYLILASQGLLMAIMFSCLKVIARYHLIFN